MIELADFTLRGGHDARRLFGPRQAGTTSNKSLREALPVTSSLASRYGIEAGHRMRLWAEFDRASALVS